MARDMHNLGYGPLLRKVTGVDLFAAEAHFHRSCITKSYSKHQTREGYHRSKKEEGVNLSLTAYMNAYEAVKMLIQREIITDQNVFDLRSS